MTENEFDKIMCAIEDASSFVYCTSKILRIGIIHSIEYGMDAGQISDGVDSFIEMSRFYMENKVRECNYLINPLSKETIKEL